MEANRSLSFCHELLRGREEEFSYQMLATHSERLAALFSSLPEERPTVAIFGSRSYRTFLAAVSAVRAGVPFVCVNPAWPAARGAAVLNGTGAGMLVVTDERYTPGAKNLQAHKIPAFNLDDLEKIPKGGALSSASSGRNRPAYFVATSGSTGEPKIIPIHARSLEAYLAAAPERNFLGPGARASQTFDLSFDPGIGDLFNAILSGACLVPVMDHHRANLPAYFRHARLTYWNSAPSLLGQAFGLGQFDDFTQADVRQLCFIGEAFPSGLAQKILATFPGAEIWNQYGPAEATIAVSAHLWKLEEALPVVSIGRLFPGVRGLMLEESGAVAPISSAHRGELLLSGAQVFEGYVVGGGSPFLQVEGERFFRTGDLVECDSKGDLHFLGRTDWNFKVAGHRVDPREVEQIFLAIPGIRGAIHLPAPPEADGFPRSSLLLLEGEAELSRLQEALERCRDLFPAAQVPRDFFLFPAFPLNPHLKTDRAALAAMAARGGGSRLLII